MNYALKTFGHISYYAMLAVLVSFGISFVYSPLPEPFGLILQAISMIILGLAVPTGPQKERY